MSLETVSIRMSADLKKKLQIEAKKEKRSLSNHILLILEKVKK